MFSTLERTKRLEEHLQQKAEEELKAATAAASAEAENEEDELECATPAVSEEAEACRYSRSFGR
jgi:hypothetical protein